VRLVFVLPQPVGEIALDVFGPVCVDLSGGDFFSASR
jgi:hypothetical protein